nr:MAG TPA: hypothetical protein [Caudoviricetes sp.]
MKAFWPFQIRPFLWKGYLYYITLNPVRDSFNLLAFWVVHQGHNN